ncbi:MAG: divergent PAP2 family protein [Chloroflexi bacterium]|nr:divergent PAP2 family protein [Chloroflexota bacterium]
MGFKELLQNEALIAGTISLLIAQLLKPIIHFFKEREWDWFQLIQSGGMPSSHSSLVTSLALSTGLWKGFNSASFSLAMGMVVIVTYDAANVRWQSGLQAQRINQLIRDVFSGQPISDQLLKEVIGHTPLQVIAGILLGIVISIIFHMFWA